MNFLANKLKCGGCDLIWVLTQLPVKVWMVVCIHTALKNLSIRGSVKKPGCNPQRAYSITASPNSRILLHFDIAAVSSSLVAVDLYGNSFRPASLL